MGKHTTSSRRNTAKILASVALVAGAASVAGLGTFGAFTSTTSASQEVATGKLTIGLTQSATAGTTIAASNLVPGDTVQRAVTLTRSSDTEAFGSVKLTTSPTVSNLLSSDAANGLQLKLDQCSVAWTKVGATSELALLRHDHPGPGLARRRRHQPRPRGPGHGAQRHRGGLEPADLAVAPRGGQQLLPGAVEHHRLHLRRHPAHRSVQVT